MCIFILINQVNRVQKDLIRIQFVRYDGPVSLVVTSCGSKSLKVILIDSDFRGYPVLNPLVTL
jgi:hypothetical protein